MVVWAPLSSKAINAVPLGVGSVNSGVNANQTVPAARFSPGVADIVKLADAKVDAEVIRTYVKNSSTAYNPTATEIIALKDRGVAPEILTAMLQRGAEIRGQSMRAAQAAQSAAAAPPNLGAAAPYAPVYDYGSQPVYPSYNYSYPVSSYVYPSGYSAYGYGYSDYSYGGPYYGWPYYWPSLAFSFGCYPYRGYCGYGYSGWRGGYGYGGRGYYGGHAYYGGAGYHGQGGRPAPYGGSPGGYHSFGGGVRPASFASSAGGFRGGGGFNGHAVSFGGAGGARSGGSFGGGYSMGRSH